MVPLKKLQSVIIVCCYFYIIIIDGWTKSDFFAPAPSFIFSEWVFFHPSHFIHYAKCYTMIFVSSFKVTLKTYAVKDLWYLISPYPYYLWVFQLLSFFIKCAKSADYLFSRKKQLDSPLTLLIIKTIILIIYDLR